MAKLPPFPLESLRHLFAYDAATGNLIWRNPVSNKVVAGDVAGTLMNNGYVKIVAHDHQLYAHHVVWYLHHGEWPHIMIDHENGCGADNRVSNLRQANQAQQNYNTCISKRNKSGIKGVIWAAREQRWRAHIVVDRKQIHLGYHRSIEDAARARAAAEAQYCGEFVRKPVEVGAP